MGKSKGNKKKTMKIPKTVQQSIPYQFVFEENGIIQTEDGEYTKSYLIQDVNYQIANFEEKFDLIQKYSSLLNSFPTSTSIQITINNRNINHEEVVKKTLISERGDNLDRQRNEYNKILLNKMAEGRNNLKSEKYITVSTKAKNESDAVSIFQRFDGELSSNLQRMGSNAHPLSTIERLEILHDIYNLGAEGEFYRKTNIDNKNIESFSFKNMRRMGLTTKDVIGPDSLEFQRNYFMSGDKYGRILYLNTLPSTLTDNYLSELTTLPYNMITSIHLESVEQEKALRHVRNKLTTIRSNVVDAQKKAAKGGYDATLISPELQAQQDEANEFLKDLTSRNQKMFFATLVIAHFADTLEELNIATETIKNTSGRFLCTLKNLTFQQEQGLTCALPLAKNLLSIKRTLSTESTAILMPFNSQELLQEGGIYYGLNATSHNLIMINRRLESGNSNGFILGTSGAGKSFAAKTELVGAALATHDDIIVIDPMGEYTDLIKNLGGEVVALQNGYSTRINPLDMNKLYAAGDGDPIAMKSEFFLSLCEVVLGGQYGLSPVQNTIIDRCVRQVYRVFADNNYNADYLPTLKDFYKVLLAQPEREAREIALALEIYVNGTLNLFADKTNVKYNSRIVSYDIRNLGDKMQTFAMLVVLNNAWNKIIENRIKGIRTWLYIDEIHLLLRNEVVARFLQKMYKVIRKMGGIPTGITQNVEDLLLSETARTMLANSDFVMMLNQATTDKIQLATLLNISDAQLSYITNAEPGTGLIFKRPYIVPFANRFPKNTELYKLMTTRPDDL